MEDRSVNSDGSYLGCYRSKENKEYDERLQKKMANLNIFDQTCMPIPGFLEYINEDHNYSKLHITVSSTSTVKQVAVETDKEMFMAMDIN